MALPFNHDHEPDIQCSRAVKKIIAHTQMLRVAACPRQPPKGRRQLDETNTPLGCITRTIVLVGRDYKHRLMNKNHKVVSFISNSTVFHAQCLHVTSPHFCGCLLTQSCGLASARWTFSWLRVGVCVSASPSLLDWETKSCRNVRYRHSRGALELLLLLVSRMVMSLLHSRSTFLL